MPTQCTWARRLVVSAVTTAVAVAMSSTIAPAAQAAGPPTIEVAAGTPRVYESWNYGEDSSRTPIAPTSRQITIEHPVVAVIDVTCELKVAGTAVSRRTATAATWNEPVPIELAVPSGVVTTDPRKSVQVKCHSYDVSSPASFTLSWLLTTTTSAPTAVVVFDDPATRSRVYSERYYTVADPIKILPGAVLKISGPPGTWDVPYYPPWWEDGPREQGYLSVPDSEGRDVRPDITADGSTITITVPENVPAAFLETTVRLDLSTWGERGASFLEAELDLNADLPSTTALSVSPTRILSVHRPTATVRIEALHTRIPVGTVTIQVDGRPVATAKLTATDSGKVSVRLPTMRRGTHTVAASFAGPPGIAASVSKTVQVQVIR